MHVTIYILHHIITSQQTVNKSGKGHAQLNNGCQRVHVLNLDTLCQMMIVGHISWDGGIIGSSVILRNGSAQALNRWFSTGTGRSWRRMGSE